jgi:hypothetical protein
MSKTDIIFVSNCDLCRFHGSYGGFKNLSRDAISSRLLTLLYIMIQSLVKDTFHTPKGY